MRAASKPRSGRLRRWPVPPSLLIGIAPVVVFAVISVVRARPSDDYSAVGTTVDSVVHSLLIPEAITAGAIAIIVTALGWWPRVAVDSTRGKPVWAVAAPALLVLVSIVRLPFVGWSAMPPTYFLLLAAAVLLVGVFEEIMARGMLLVGLRRRLPEFAVWIVSSAVFGLLHLVNALAGQSIGITIVQVVFAAAFGSGLYVARRMTRSLLAPVLLHALWDFGSIGVSASDWHGSLIVLGIIGLMAMPVLVFSVVAAAFVSWQDDRPRRTRRKWAAVPSRAEFGVREVPIDSGVEAPGAA